MINLQPTDADFVCGPGEKTCRRCGEAWPADTEFFFRVRARPDGLHKICKACFWEIPSMARRYADRVAKRKATFDKKCRPGVVPLPEDCNRAV